MGNGNGSPNASSATGTRNRVQDVAPQSGICAVCLDGCPGSCEVGRSSFRGREVMYPAPFGKVTAGATKQYPVDYSHLNIQGTCVGAVGMAADSDKAIFPAVSTQVELGHKHKVKLNIPVFTGALGSTDIAKDNWDGLAIGAAISGIMVVIGENVVGMDPQAEIKAGAVVKSPELERRVKCFKEWYNGAGEIILQQNVEDTRLRSAEYAVEKLGVNCIELKWGQGAKDIGGEVKLKTMERADELKKRGYIVLPDPTDASVRKGFEEEEFKEFERHSRLGMVEQEGFMKAVQHYRKVGAKFVSLKTGAYRISDLARAIRFASDAEIDLLTIDGAGGGTGMSPWRMMNEWGIPTIYLQSLAYKFASQLKAKGKYVPDMAIAGGFSLEDHIFKGLALGAPYFKAVCMGRALMIPAFVGKNIKKWIEEDKLPVDIKKYGDVPERIFITTEILKTQVRKGLRPDPLGRRGHVHLCRPAETGSPAAHGRGQEVLAPVHRPERPRFPDQGRRGCHGHSLCHGVGHEGSGAHPDQRRLGGLAPSDAYNSPRSAPMGGAGQYPGAQEMNRTLHAILSILDKYSTVVGSRELSRQLTRHGVELTERTVRYYLKMLDQQGYTEVHGKEGRKITTRGREELRLSLVSDKIGFVISRIETLSYLTTLDMATMEGDVILNVSYFPRKSLRKALDLLKPVFASPFVMSDRVILAPEGEAIGEAVVPAGMMGLGTICSVTINGIFLKAGIPVASRFGGVVETADSKPQRFLSLISYAGSSLDPLEVFIKSKMTAVSSAVMGRNGRILASFREIPVVCLDKAAKLARTLEDRGIRGILMIGGPNKPLLEVPVGIDKVGIVIIGGLNPVAVLEEAGIATESKAMSTLFDYTGLDSFKDVLRSYQPALKTRTLSA